MRSLLNEEDAAEIKQRLLALRPDDARQWGEMTVSEMLCHVRGAFRTAMGEVERTGPPLRLPLPPRVMKFVALRMPTQWPKSLPTLPELKRGAPAMDAGTFEEEQRLAMSTMAQFLQRDQRLGDHAMFGAMTRGDWMRWGYLHTDHHLRQFGR